jgi:signal transduction histidine kinase
MSGSLRILLVEDNPGDVRLCRELLREGFREEFALEHAATLAAAIAAQEKTAAEVVLLDLSLPDAQGLTGVKALRRRFPRLPIVVLSGLADEALSIEALQNGAQDYLVKGQGEGSLVARAVRYAVERKRIEHQLIEEKERAELASRAKSQFLATMSHELRTPLNAIIGFSELLGSDLAVAERNRVEYAKDIRDSGSHLLRIINDILDLSKIEAGKLALDLEPVAMKEVVESCRRIVAERAAEAQLELAVDCPADLPLVRGDLCKLKQIVLNLVSNSVKFTPAGGRIVIRAAAAGPAIAVTVEDSGIGIAEEDIPTALAPFGQVDSSLARKYAGTGLGLSLTKSLVELHGGTFELSSRPAQGTTIRFTLPVVEVAAAEAA